MPFSITSVQKSFISLPVHDDGEGQRRNAENERAKRPTSYRKLILLRIILLQLALITGLHMIYHGEESSHSSNSPMISETLQNFVVGPTPRNTSYQTASSGSQSLGLLYKKHEKKFDNLWDQSTTIPQWMKDYLNWHREQMVGLNEDNWKTKRFLIMQCLEEDERCGGTADRLKPIPSLTMLANQTNRVLLIRWEKPCKVQEFLLPPQGGLDWRVPDWLESRLPRKPFAPSLPVLESLSKSEAPVAMSRYQSYNAGANWFDERTNETTFFAVYHDLWRTFFTPVPPIAAMVQESMKAMHLNPGQYASAHLRALYGRKSRPLDQIHAMASTALNCASSLNPGSPIYFATDSTEAVKFAQQYGLNKSAKIVSVHDDEDPLHLDKANWRERRPQEYFSTFRDLYLLGLGNCVAYNEGGFGNWGLMISNNWTCGTRYVRANNRHTLIDFDWTDGTSKPASAYEPATFEPPIGMISNVISVQKIVKDEPLQKTTTGRFSARTTSTLPPWLEEYFQWHTMERIQLSESNWESKKFLIMACTLEDPKCGGTADRLKPLPAILFLAHRTKRILLIYWDKPCRLEEFLVPPPGGLNWTLPSFMEPKLKDTKKLVDLQRIEMVLDDYGDPIVRLRVQSNSGGAEFYEKWTNTTHDSFYHEMFHSVFAPSPPVGKLISKSMTELGLQPGEYAAAHLRAMYGRQDRPEQETAEFAINAVNCASQLRPGGPIYFAADSKHAVEIVKDYAKETSRPIVSLIHDDEPLHIDRAVNATTRHPSEFYATFVDLYLLGESRCLSYNIGGFGTWGLLLGYNSSCVSRHLKQKKMSQCQWMDA